MIEYFLSLTYTQTLKQSFIPLALNSNFWSLFYLLPNQDKGKEIIHIEILNPKHIYEGKR